MGNLIDDLRKYLESANVNLGRKTTKREAFINDIISMVEGVSPSKPKKPGGPKVVDDRMVVTKPKKPQTDKTFQMTESKSMKADEELGNNPVLQQERFEYERLKKQFEKTEGQDV